MQVGVERAAASLAGADVAEANAPAVELLNVSRHFGDVAAVRRMNLSVRRGEFFSLLGPSGCGKTTLLRLIAGLDLPDSGAVYIDGKEATTTPAHQRPVNTVFQSYALFPHLSARENVAFGLRMKKTPRTEIEERVARVLEMVQIPELADRRPAQLSGGQKQRVALARAIVNEPQVLLLDEPLGALDFKLRKELQVELHSLQRRLGITFIHVTHDQEEALAMSDRVGVMNSAQLEQIGPVTEVYEKPRTRFVAQFLGSCNLLGGTAQRVSGRTLWASTRFGEVQAELEPMTRPIETGQACTLAIRPEKVSLRSVSPGREANCFAARVNEIVYTGAETQYRLETSGGPLNAWVMNAKAGPPAFRVGQELMVHLPPAALVLLED